MNDKKIPPPPTLPPVFNIDEKYCLFHKGEIQGEIYTCPRCKTRYCLNCALEAKQEKKLCIKCKQLIDL